MRCYEDEGAYEAIFSVLRKDLNVRGIFLRYRFIWVEIEISTWVEILPKPTKIITAVTQN